MFWRVLRAACAALILSCFVGWSSGDPKVYSFKVVSKTWTTVPKEYQLPYPQRRSCVGAWESMSGSRQGMLYSHRVGEMGWKYTVKDQYGRKYTIFSGREWSWSGGDSLLITGEISESAVFIPQGVYVYD